MCISRDESLHSFFIDDHCLDIDLPGEDFAITSHTNDASSSNELIKTCSCAICNKWKKSDIRDFRDCRICTLVEVPKFFSCDQQMLGCVRKIFDEAVLTRISLKGIVHCLLMR